MVYTFNNFSHAFAGFAITKDGEKPWLGTCKTVIYPMSNEVELGFVENSDVLNHLAANRGSTAVHDLNSFIAIGMDGSQLYPYFRSFANPKPLTTLFKGSHFLYPTVSAVKSKVEEIRRVNVLSDCFAWLDCQVLYQRSGIFSWQYGNLTAFECPLKRDVRFYSLPTLQGFLTQDPSRERYSLSILDAIVVATIIRGFSMFQKLQILGSEACYLYKCLHQAKNGTVVTLSLADLAAYTIVQDLAQEMNAIVQTSFSHFLLQSIMSAKQYQANPTSRSSEGACQCNALFIAALQFFKSKFIFSSLGLLFMDKRNKVVGLEHQHTLMSKNVDNLLREVHGSSMPSNVQLYVQAAHTRLGQLHQLLAPSSAPLA